MADETRLAEALTGVLEKALGRDLKEKINWATYDRGPIPNKVAAGYGVISDPNVNKIKVTELFLLCESARNAMCNPVDGRTRGPMVCSSLYPQIKGGELVIHQYTPYPPTRSDGMAHITGILIYPHLQNPNGWTEADGTYYSKASARGQEMLRAATTQKVPPVEKFTSSIKEIK